MVVLTTSLKVCVANCCEGQQWLNWVEEVEERKSRVRWTANRSFNLRRR